MFHSLKSRFKDIFNSIGKKISIDEKDLDQIIRDIRLILLEADVSLDLLKILMPKIKEELLNKEIYRSISPKQIVLKATYDKLLEILENNEQESSIHSKPTTFCMIVGLQGTGKTSSCAKIAHNLQKKFNKKILLTSLDLSRPAAYDQLQILAQNNNLDFFPHNQDNLKKIITDIKDFASKNLYDLVILDTAGRLSIDENLMLEMQEIYNLAKPKEVLLAIDSMLGQTSFDVAKKFKEKIPLSGIIITKADADSRGGAIISCKFVTQVPIKFMPVGEKINDIENFIPKRIIDRILDQGDIISLIENLENTIDEEDSKLEEKLMKGQFSLEDLKKQILTMRRMGGAGSMLSMIPGLSGIMDKAKNNMSDSTFKKHIAIIDSMTKLERKKPNILNFSRKQRIANGSATTLQDINILLKQFDSMSKMFKKFKNVGSNPMDMLKSMGLDPSKIKR